MLNIKKLLAIEENFSKNLQQLLSWNSISNEDINTTVKKIIHNVRQKGDVALLKYTQQFDNLNLSDAKQLEITQQQIKEALQKLPVEQRESLEISAKRVRAYHEKQIMQSWQYKDEHGNLLGQQITSLDTVGLYVPGGKAAYPSSVIMNSIPAKVAGVENLIMVVPTPNGEINSMVLAAAAICGVDKVFSIGGAQAIAALAYGTNTIPKVDKIVGPGNIYVSTAKRNVFGDVGIDMIAGPSEILVYCDGTTNPDWIAMDLFSQAEHDENAQSILVTTKLEFLEKVHASMNKLLPKMDRKDIIKKSLEDRGALILVNNEAEAIDVINTIAPEHLELSVENPEDLLPKIKHAGAIFMGSYTTEAIGDYVAGPNHVLPTSGTAKFSSPLGVYDFQKRSSIIMCTPEGAKTLGKTVAVLANGENLQAHADSASYRING